MEEQMQMEAMQAQQRKQREAQNTNLIRDGDDDEDNQEVANDDEDMDVGRMRQDFGADEGQSKVVQEARKLMQDAEE